MSRVSADSEVYQQAMAGKCGATDTFLGAMGYKEINIYTPLRRDGKITGGVYVNLMAEELRSTGNTLYESSGYSYLVKRDGTILLAPSTFSFAQIYRNVRDVFLISENNQETVDAFMAALENGDSGSAILNFSGNLQIICFEPLEKKEGWYYVSVLPLDLVEANGQAVVRLSSRMVTVFVVIILIFVLSLLGILFFMFQDKWRKEVNDGRVYRAISQNIHTAIFIMDQHTGRIRRAFENMWSILGIDANQVQGSVLSRDWLSRVGLPAQVADLVEEAETFRRSATMELEHYNPSQQKTVWLRISVSPLHLKGRKEYMAAFTDITENKRLMEELRESMLAAQSAGAAKSSFLANMSHDIRTPMNAITGMTAI